MNLFNTFQSELFDVRLKIKYMGPDFGLSNLVISANSRDFSNLANYIKHIIAHLLPNRN